MSSRPPSVLTVDDNRDFCDRLFDCLENLNVDANFTHDPKPALYLAQSREFDIALVDLNMPRMDGLTLFREMRQLHPRMRGVLMTGYAQAETERDAEAHGLSAVLHKPIDFDQVIAMVSSGSEV